MDGIISSVTTQPLGAQVMEVAASGATVLVVEHVSDFADEGGQLQLASPAEVLTTLAYSGVDRDACTITLASPLPWTVDDESFAAVYPPASVQVASVLVDEESAPGETDTIEALVPFTMRAMLVDGIRDDPDMAEQVVVGVVGGEYTLTDLRNQVPVIALAVLPDQVSPSIPAQVASVALSASLYVDGYGQTHAALTATCTPVTSDINGAALTPTGYELWGQPSGQEYRRITTAASNVITWRPFVPGSVWNFMARAYYRSAVGDFSPEVAATFLIDTTPPDAPSIPLLTSKSGFITVTWDGLTAGGGAMPADYQAVRVHLSTVDGFTPASVTEKALITSIRGGAVTLGGLPYDTVHYVRLVAIDKSGNASAPSAQATITTGRLTDYDIASLSVAKLTAGTLQADVWIKAGDPSGFFSMMDASGFSTWRPDPEGAAPVQAGHFGTGQSDFLQWTGPDGDVRAAVDEMGRATFQGVSIPQQDDGYELNIYGMEFTDWLGQSPRGVRVRSSISTNTTPTTAEAVVMEVRGMLEPERLYKVKVETHYVDVADPSNVETRLRVAYGGAAVGTASDEIGRTRTVMSTTAAKSCAGCFGFISTAGQSQDREVRIAYTIESAGAGSTAWVEATSTYPCTLYLEDMGPAIPETAALAKYVSVWTASNSRAYAAGGSARSDSTYAGYSNTPMTVGYCEGSLNYSLAIFGGNATSGEKSRTIASALSGATIEKVELYLYAQYSQSSSLKVDVRSNTLTAIANTAPSGTAIRATIPQGTGRWVDITSLWSASSRGIWVGPTVSGTAYHGHIRSHLAGSGKPQVRITYRR